MNKHDENESDHSELNGGKDVYISGIHHHHCKCRRGPRGPRGPRGATGPAGPTGPTGPGGITDFAYLASTVEQTIAAAPAPGAQGGAVTYNYTVINGTAISFTAPSSININEPGFYNISWEVFPVGGNTAFALFFDPTGAPLPALVPASNYGSGSGNQPYQGQVIAQFTSTGVLTLNRIDAMGNVTLQNDVGGNGPAVISASVVIERLA